MPKFPKDAPKAQVVATLEALGFQIVRERERALGRAAEPPGSVSADESTSSPAIPVSLFSGCPPRAMACLETGSDLGK
jgi:hypothetical protein